MISDRSHSDENTVSARFNPVTLQHTGRPGRPKKIIDPNWLRAAMLPSNGFTITDIARYCDVHTQTVYKALTEHQIPHKYSQITDDELDQLIEEFKLEKPESGYRYALGYLRSHGIRVQHIKVLDSLRRTDGLGQQLRTHQAVERQRYSVPRSNYLWHMDGHHKLIGWGIVIHGIIDGHCHTVSIIYPHTNLY